MTSALGMRKSADLDCNAKTTAIDQWMAAFSRTHNVRYVASMGSLRKAFMLWENQTHIEFSKVHLTSSTMLSFMYLKFKKNDFIIYIKRKFCSEEDVDFVYFVCVDIIYLFLFFNFKKLKYLFI